MVTKPSVRHLTNQTLLQEQRPMLNPNPHLIRTPEVPNEMTTLAVPLLCIVCNQPQLSLSRYCFQKVSKHTLVGRLGGEGKDPAVCLESSEEFCCKSISDGSLKGSMFRFQVRFSMLSFVYMKLHRSKDYRHASSVVEGKEWIQPYQTHEIPALGL